jgi:hypothetical protein
MASDPEPPSPAQEPELPSYPDGPCLLYVSGRTAAGHVTVTPVDRTALDDRRERALFRALTGEALTLADQADADAQPKTEARTGHYA